MERILNNSPQFTTYFSTMFQYYNAIKIMFSMPSPFSKCYISVLFALCVLSAQYTYQL